MSEKSNINRLKRRQGSKKLSKKADKTNVDEFADLPSTLAAMLKRNKERAKTTNAGSKELHDTEFKYGERFDVSDLLGDTLNKLTDIY